MNLEFVNKIIKTFFKILKNFKIIKTNMATNNNKPQEIINSNTIIEFTLKSFIGTISSILGLFIGFYFMVVVPKEKAVENYQKELFNQYKEYVTNEFNKVNSAININTTSINDLAKRFNDFNESIENMTNSGGSLSSEIVVKPDTNNNENVIAINTN